MSICTIYTSLSESDTKIPVGFIQKHYEMNTWLLTNGKKKRTYEIQRGGRKKQRDGVEQQPLLKRKQENRVKKLNQNLVKMIGKLVDMLMLKIIKILACLVPDIILTS